MVRQSTRLWLAARLGRMARRMAPPAASRTLSKCLRELELYSRHLEGVRRSRKMLADGASLRLELGGGMNSKPGWVNVDLSARDGLSLDLCRPLPFPDQSVAAIHSEHLLEHFTHPDGLSALLSECHRVLRLGGTFSAGVPDAGRAFSAYAAGPGAFYCAKYWPNDQPGLIRCPMDELNWLIYMGGVHHHMFDERSLRHRLEEAGFTDVHTRGFDPELDRPDRQHQSIYVEANKAAPGPPDAAHIHSRHVQELLDELASHTRVAPMVTDLCPTDRYTTLRLATLMAGRWGPTLLVGRLTGSLLRVLDLVEVPRTPEVTGIMKPDALDDLGPGQEINERIKSHDYPPLPYRDRRFRQVVAVIDGGDLTSTPGIMAEVHRVLIADGRGWACVTVPADWGLEISRMFTLLHSESLPAGSGTLKILKRIPHAAP